MKSSHNLCVRIKRLKDPRHKDPSLDTASFLTDMKALFHLPTVKEYKYELVKISRKWSAVFFELAPDITCIAKWAFEQFGVHNPFSGVTNHQVRGLYSTFCFNITQITIDIS